MEILGTSCSGTPAFVMNSLIWSPILIMGSHAWDTFCGMRTSSFRRIRSNSLLGIDRRSRPLNRISPSTEEFLSRMPKTAETRTDLPDPDSPTIDTVSDGLTTTSRSLTAWRTSSPMRNLTFSPLISSRLIRPPPPCPNSNG